MSPFLVPGHDQIYVAGWIYLQTVTKPLFSWSTLISLRLKVLVISSSKFYGIFYLHLIVNEVLSFFSVSWCDYFMMVGIIIYSHHSFQASKTLLNDSEHSTSSHPTSIIFTEAFYDRSMKERNQIRNICIGVKEYFTILLFNIFGDLVILMNVPDYWNHHIQVFKHEIHISWHFLSIFSFRPWDRSYLSTDDTSNRKIFHRKLFLASSFRFLDRVSCGGSRWE